MGDSLDLRILLSAQDTASQVVKAFGGNLSALATGPVGLAVTAVAGIGMAAVGFASDSVQAAGDFQQSMLKVSAYAGLSKQQTDQMAKSITDMAVQVGVRPKELADAIYPIVSSGYSAADALNILKLSAQTAAASGAQTSTVADMLTTSLKSMGAPASQAGHYMDMFNKIVSLGKGEVPQYGAVIGKLSLAAVGAKVPFDQMGAALATLTTHGFPSVAQASTALGNLFTQIGPKVDSLAAHAKKLGINFDESAFKSMDLSHKMAYLQEVTGGNQGQMLKLLGGSTLALKAFTALSSSTKDFASNLDQMKNSQGATANAFATASDGYNFKMKQMNASFDVLKITIGNALLPILTKFLSWLTPLVVAFTDWITKSGAAQKASDGLTQVIKVAGDIFQWLKPYIIEIAQELFKFGQEVEVRLMPIIKNFSAWWKANWPALQQIFSAVWNIIQGDIKVAWAVVSGIIKIGLDILGGNWKQAWTDFKDMLSGIWDGMKQTLSGDLNLFIGLIRVAGPAILNWLTLPFQGAWSQISSIFGSIGAGVGALMNGNIPGALHDFGVPGFANGVQNFGGGFAMVGERGPEMVYLPKGSNVYPNGTNPLKGNASGGNRRAGGGDTYTFNISINVPGRSYNEAQEMGRIVKQEIAKLMRGQGITPTFTSGGESQ